MPDTDKLDNPTQLVQALIDVHRSQLNPDSDFSMPDGAEKAQALLAKSEHARKFLAGLIRLGQGSVYDVWHQSLGKPESETTRRGAPSLQQAYRSARDLRDAGLIEAAGTGETPARGRAELVYTVTNLGRVAMYEEKRILTEELIDYLTA